MVWFMENKIAIEGACEAPEGYKGPRITQELWEQYKYSRLGEDYDIIDGQFVQLHTPEEFVPRVNAEQRIVVLKQYLADTDYIAIKFLEGVAGDEEYLPIKQKRIEARAEINQLQEQYNL